MSAATRGRTAPRRDGGFALLTVLVVVVLVGLIGSTGLRTSELAEMMSGSVIQRSRAFQTAEGALILREQAVPTLVRTNVRADASASDGIFSRDDLDLRWWREENYAGAEAMPGETFLGVAAQPRLATEELGSYVADGGSGIVSLDRGSAGYGRLTNSGREVVLFRLQSHGTGSVESVKAVIESLYVQTR